MSIKKLVEKLTKIQSISWNTTEIVDFIKNELNWIWEIFETNKWWLVCKIKWKNDKYSRVIDAHVDTIWIMVNQIKESWNLSVTKIWWFFYNSYIWENCIIVSSLWKKYTWTLLPIPYTQHHSLNDENIELNWKNIEIRLDIENISKQKVEKLGIWPWDYVYFSNKFEENNWFIKSRYLDNKLHVWILIDTIKKIKNLEMPFTTYFYFSSTEEIWFWWSLNWKFKNVVEYLSLDIAIADIDQNSDEYSVTILCKDSWWPYNLSMIRHLEKLAINNKINYKKDVFHLYKSDSSQALFAWDDIKNWLIWAWTSASHSIERTHKKAIINTQKLLISYLLSWKV